MYICIIITSTGVNIIVLCFALLHLFGGRESLTVLETLENHLSSVNFAKKKLSWKMQSQTRNKRYMLQQKIRAVERFLNNEATQVQLAKEFKVNQTTISCWVQNKEELIELLQVSDGKNEKSSLC